MNKKNLVTAIISTTMCGMLIFLGGGAVLQEPTRHLR